MGCLKSAFYKSLPQKSSQNRTCQHKFTTFKVNKVNLYRQVQTWDIWGNQYTVQHKLRSEMNRTKVSHKILLIKSSGDHFIFLPVYYLIMWVMKTSKNFGKIAILKIWELISLWDVKTYFGKLALKWCIFRHEKKIF